MKLDGKQNSANIYITNQSNKPLKIVNSFLSLQEKKDVGSIGREDVGNQAVQCSIKFKDKYDMIQTRSQTRGSTIDITLLSTIIKKIIIPNSSRA